MRKIAIILLILAVCMVIFFTFQLPDHSRDLSEGVGRVLQRFGIYIGYNELRRFAHIVEYFLLGLAIETFAVSIDGNIYIAVCIGCVIGLLDEMVKILLPGREFSSGDMLRDWLGIGLATVITLFILHAKQ